MTFSWHKQQVLLLLALMLVLAASVAYYFNHGDSNDSAAVTQQSNIPVVNDITPTNTQTTDTTAIDPNATPQWRIEFDRLIAIQNEMMQKPDVSRVDEIMLPTCKCYSQTRSGVQEMIDNKWRVKGNLLDARAVALISQDESTRRISVGFNPTGSPTIDEGGKIVEPGPTGVLEPVLYVLKKNSDGQWLIADRQVYGERQSL